jgi:acetyl esterase/lipase
MPSAEFQTILNTLRAAPSRADLSLRQLRDQLEQQAKQAPVPADVRLRPIDAGGVPCEWVLAPGADELRAILYFHGGGYYRGSLNTHRELCSRIGRISGWPVLNVAYRLAPEHPFPAALDDALAVWRWLVAGDAAPGRTSGIAPGRVVVAGDSAGGGLAAALMLALKEQHKPMPGGAVLLSPWTDLEQTGPSMRTRAAADPSLTKAYLDRFAKAYAGETDPCNPLVSPLYGDLAGLPPLQIQVGTAEVLEDDSARFAARAEAAGVTVRLERWPDMIHVWQRYAMVLPEAREAIDRIGEWVRALPS